MIFWSIACTSPAHDALPDGGEDTASAAEDVSYLKGTAPLAEPSAGECPGFTDSGRYALTANGVEREVRLLVPSTGGEGAPVVFVWHPLGATASQMVTWFDLGEWADATGAVLVVPFAKSENLFEWDFWNGLTDDAVLYDDVRTCLYQDLGVDLGRVSSTGMSAGGLYTSWLGVYRSDTLATILPMSGGTGSMFEYEATAWAYPAMLVYGGESDTWGGSGFQVDFEETTLAFAGQLAGDGHYVALCDHGGGHTFPREGMDMMATWLLAHEYGAASPFAGDLSGFPEWCGVYEP